MILVATNNHIGYSKLYLVTSVLAILLCVTIINSTHNVSYVPLSLLVIDVVMLFYVFKKSLILSRDTLNDFIIDLKIDIYVLIDKIKNKLCEKL
ncbi:MAG: hypothetical protein LBE13_04010 [Bacteroidales bacterium]|nr:hypothetical protein [Bacteroidales bacterium]